MDPQDIRILIGCEQSGTVRNAFNALGFDAWSCDLLPDEHRSNRHMQCDIREVLNDDWDLAVMHPPCTRLTNSGVRWLTSMPPSKLSAENYSLAEVDDYKTMNVFERHAFMWESLEKGAQLFSDCWNADIPCKAIENPVMHKYAKELIKNFQPATQTVQPWWFGDGAFKGTGLHLKNLPPLIATNKLTPPKKDTDEHKAWSQIHRASPGRNRSKIRSKTFPGIADAMAEQWGAHLLRTHAAAA